MLKTTMIAAALTAALLATAGAAEAGKRHGHGFHGFHGHHHHHRRHFGFVYTAPIYVGAAYEGCGYAYARWQSTGSFYWKKRYYICKGWY